MDRFYKVKLWIDNRQTSLFGRYKLYKVRLFVVAGDVLHFEFGK